MERKRKLQKHSDIFSEQVRYYKNNILMESTGGACLARSAKNLMIRTESYLVENIFTLNNADNGTAALFYLNCSIINYLN